jgi:hypothetical protein
MADLTVLEEKLGEVIGLAQAAQDVTSKVSGLPEATDELKAMLKEMGNQAAEAQERGEKIADQLDGKKTALLDKARETKSEATEMMKTYLGDDADALDGLEFLIMSEAGELGHVEIAGTLAEKAGHRDIIDFIQWALPVQATHVERVRGAALELAGEQDPNETE